MRTSQILKIIDEEISNYNVLFVYEASVVLIKLKNKIIDIELNEVQND